MIDKTRIFDGDKDYIEECKHRVRTDGFFLAPLLGFDKFDPIIHKPVADLYITKNKDLPIEDQHPIKNRMHLDPRATFKSTWGYIDTYQWIVNFPDMTIGNETATQPLANAMSDLIAGKFELPPGTQPSILQKLFPEWNVSRLPTGEDYNYNAPCRTYDQTDKTLASTSVRTTQAGWHPWLVNADDCVDTNNSGIYATDTSRNKVISNHGTNINTIRPGGYLNLRGTRYHPFDLYGVTLQKMLPSMWKTLIRSSIRMRDGSRLKEGDFPEPEEIEILFPGILSYDYLHQKFVEDYINFMCQQQNDPMGGSNPTFEQSLYHSTLTVPELVPPFGDTYVCWRLPFDGKDFMKNYAEGAAVRYNGNRAYVIGTWRGIYTPSELSEKIVATLKTTGARHLLMENVPGCQYAITNIQNEMVKRNWSAKVEVKDFESNDADRDSRCKQLQPMMKAGRIKIATNITRSSETRAQFETYGLISRNGIVDCISRLANRLPSSIINDEISEEQKFLHQAQSGRAAWNLIYGQGGAQVVEDVIATDTRKQVKKNSYGLRPMLGGLDG